MDSENIRSDVGDIASLFANDEKDDNLMNEIDNFINNKPLDTPANDKAASSLEEVMKTHIKQEDGSGFITVASLTKKTTKSEPKPKAPLKKKKVKKPASQQKTSFNLSTVAVKQEPPSDDEFAEAEKSSKSPDSKVVSEKDPSSKAQDLDYQEASSSSGKDKPIIKESPAGVKVAHGVKLNAIPVVLLEKLDLSRMSLKLAALSDSSELEGSPKVSKYTDVIPEEHSPSPPILKKADKKSLIKKSISVPKPDKPKSESTTIKAVVDRAFLGLGDQQLLEPSPSTGTSKYELSLSPIVLADLSSEPFRKFMNLASDCAIHFRKNQNQPLFGNVCLYFGDFITLQSAIQRLCQLPVNAHSVKLNGSIKCYDFARLDQKHNDEPAKKSLLCRLMFQFCPQRTEKLKQLVSVKDRKKENKKVQSAHINRIPASVGKDMLLLLYPFSLEVRIAGDGKKQKGLKGPVNVDFESKEMMEAVLDCMRVQAVKMTSLSSTELSTFRLYIKNYTPPKIPIEKPAEPVKLAKPTIPSLMSAAVHPTGAIGRGRGWDRTGPSPREHNVLAGRNDDRDRGVGGSGHKSNSHIERKRHHEDRNASRPNSEEKRGRFEGPDSFKQVESPAMREVNLTPNQQQQLPADPKQAIRLAAVAKGLNPNNPDVIKILEMSSQLQALQTVMGHGMMTPQAQAFSTGPTGAVFQQQQQQHRTPREMFRSPVSPGSLSQERIRAESIDRRRQASHFANSEKPGSHWDHGHDVENRSRHERGRTYESSRRNSSRERDLSGFHNRPRNSPGTHPSQRDRSRSGNRSPQESSSSSSANSTHMQPGFDHRRGGREETHARDRDAPKGFSGFDPSTNNQPLDFQGPRPVLSTEQAVKQDMVRTMQAKWQGDKHKAPDNLAPQGDTSGRQTQQHHPLAEELVLPLQFGKNAVKKTPQAILEEKRRKEREERQKKEMELTKKREEEERQKRIKEMEERHKRQKEERERQEKEAEARRRKMGPLFTPGSERQRSEFQPIEAKPDQFEPFHNRSRPGRSPGSDFVRPNQTSNPYAHSGVRFQGEAEERFQPGAPISSENPRWKNNSTIWDKAEKGDTPLQRLGPPIMPNRGGFQRGAHSANVSARGDFHQGGFPGRKNWEGKVHDVENRDNFDISADRIHATENPALGSSDKRSPQGNHYPGKPVNTRGVPAVRRPVGGRDLTSRGGHGRGAGEFNRSEQESSPKETTFSFLEAFKGMESAKAGISSRGSGRGIAPGSFSFRVEDSQKQAGYDEEDHINLLEGKTHGSFEGFRGRGSDRSRIAMRGYGRGFSRGRPSLHPEDSQKQTSYDEEHNTNPQVERTHDSAEAFKGRGSGRGQMARRGYGRGGFSFNTGDAHNKEEAGYGEEDIVSPQPEMSHGPVEAFRGRGVGRVRMAARGPMVGATRGRGIARGGFHAHAENSQQQAVFDEDNNSKFGFQGKGSIDNQHYRSGFQGAAGGHEQKQNKSLWNISQSQRGGGLGRGHALASKGRDGHQFTKNEYFEDDWQNTEHNRSGQFEEPTFEEACEEAEEPAPWEQTEGWNSGSRTPRGRGGPQRPGRGVAGRGRGFTSYGRGFDNANTEDECFSPDIRDRNYFKEPAEFPASGDANQHNSRAHGSRETSNFQRGRGFRGGAAHVGRGTDNRGRGMPAHRGAENQRGRGASRQQTETYKGASSDWDGQYGRTQQEGQANMNSPRIQQDWSPTRGAASPNRGMANFGGRGATMSNRGSSNFGARGGAASSSGSSYFGGTGSTSVNQDSSNFGGRGAAMSTRGSSNSNLGGRGAATPNRGSGNFRGRGRGLLPTPYN